MKKITLDDVKNNKEFSALIERANINLENIGYTEHGIRHVGLPASANLFILLVYLHFHVNRFGLTESEFVSANGNLDGIAERRALS